MAPNGNQKAPVQLRRYPNRRYYDATQSRYVTLQDIYSIILEGNDVQITDAKTGEDLTTKVLAQIILEHDAPKLHIFPVQLLHQLIRTNELLIRGFVESFFDNALAVFMESQRLFDRYFRIGLGTHRTEAGPQQSDTADRAAEAEESAAKTSVHSPREEKDSVAGGQHTEQDDKMSTQASSFAQGRHSTGPAALMKR